MSLVSLEGVGKRYQLGNQTVYAVRDVSMIVSEGNFLAIAGPSGSGKSTLLNLIGCIDSPTEGRVLIDGRDVSELDSDSLARYRGRTIGFIFQTFNLFPVLTAFENVEYPLLGFKELDRARRKARVDKLLDLVGLSRFAGHRPNELSGGQRQRVAIARALVTQPRVVLADEPTANLDHATGTDILRLMKSINHQHGTTFIFSTHDARVMQAADRLVRIEDGVLTGLGMRRGEKWVFVPPDRSPRRRASDAQTGGEPGAGAGAASGAASGAPGDPPTVPGTDVDLPDLGEATQVVTPSESGALR